MGAADAPPGRPSIDALTGLRFVAAAIVMIEHFPQLIPGLGQQAANQGGAGVGLFFVLSGFVLAYNYGDVFAAGLRGYGRFLHARLARIYPLHVLTLVLITVVFAAQGDPLVTDAGARTVIAWVANLVLVHAYVPSLIVHSWNGPSWSISDELSFYLVFPLFCWLVLGRFGRSALKAVVVGCVAVSVIGFVAVSLVVARHEVRTGNAEGASFLLNRIAYLPWLRVWEFFAGATVATLFATRAADGAGPLTRRAVRDGALGAVALLAVAIQFAPDCLGADCGPSAGTARALVEPKLYAVYVPLAVVVIAVIAWGPTWFGGVLRHPALLRLGEVSYAFYLLQWTTRTLLDQAGWFGAAITWLAVVATWLASFAVHRWVEAPLRRRLKPR